MEVIWAITKGIASRVFSGGVKVKLEWVPERVKKETDDGNTDNLSEASSC